MLPLLTTAYLPPIEYIAHIANAGGAVLEQHEHFVKQTYRNRAVILTANGPHALIIPLKKGKNNKQVITEVEIDYTENWQRKHWQAVVSAYNSSPFFEFYADELQPFYQQKKQYLFEYNTLLLNVLLRLLKVKADVTFTEEFIAPPINAADHRYQISPKEPNCYSGNSYRQVFAEKYPFQPNLSGLDLLFNVGPKGAGLL
jgi:hypothetical protein